MKATINYSKSPAPNFDAVNDIMEYLGEKYSEIAPQIGKVLNTEHFAFYCGLAGIEGFPVKAWYDHFHGQGAWDKMEVSVL